mmetsp:Transcript_21512/g.41037  ORF Transcript_21512/g.41037 Transcript_21512/m.41037 type:complete len:282 (+) Transcript_21512:226-1071(+)
MDPPSDDAYNPSVYTDDRDSTGFVDYLSEHDFPLGLSEDGKPPKPPNNLSNGRRSDEQGKAQSQHRSYSAASWGNNHHKMSSVERSGMYDAFAKSKFPQCPLSVMEEQAITRRLDAADKILQQQIAAEVDYCNNIKDLNVWRRRERRAQRAHEADRYHYVNVSGFKGMGDFVGKPDKWGLIRSCVKHAPTTERTALPLDEAQVWCRVRALDNNDHHGESVQRKGSYAKYFPIPPSQRYSFYRSYGFAGRGALTSWAHSPVRPPQQVHVSHSVGAETPSCSF